MCVCVCEGGKNSPQGAVVHQRGLKKDSKRAYTPSHTHTHRNSTDRKGNKKTGEFGGKTNQRDVKGERKREGDEWKEQNE